MEAGQPVGRLLLWFGRVCIRVLAVVTGKGGPCGGEGEQKSKIVLDFCLEKLNGWYLTDMGKCRTSHSSALMVET